MYIGIAVLSTTNSLQVTSTNSFYYEGEYYNTPGVTDGGCGSTSNCPSNGYGGGIINNFMWWIQQV